MTRARRGGRRRQRRGRGARAAAPRCEACDLSRAMVARGRERVPGRVLGARRRAGPAVSGRRRSTRCSRASGRCSPRAPAATARELVRVTRPGGVVALTAWQPNSLPGRVERLAPLPEGVRSPADWGREDVARKRLESLLDDVEVQTHTVRLAFEDEDALLAALCARRSWSRPARAARLRRGVRRRLPRCVGRRPVLGPLYCALACRR